MSQAALAISLFFHILATVVWIGGLLLITFLVIPQVNNALEGEAALHQILLRIRGRFAQVSNLALVVLIVTGLLQMTADPNYDGLLRLDNPWSRVLLLKHLLIAVMALLGLALQLSVAPALERVSLLLQHGKDGHSEWRRLRRKERRLSLIIALLALLILATSAWLVSI
ncbi:MAG: CopD family protein [Chloroflexota bacterium]|nr:CopD family protein [Chloroflexota bacterium]MDE2952820.1 CopD family protein [Chloroflexota bacterium]